MQTAQKTNSVEIKNGKPSIVVRPIPGGIQIGLPGKAGLNLLLRASVMRVRQDVVVNIPQSIIKTLITPEEALAISAVFRLAHDLMQPIDAHSDLHSSWNELRIVTEYDLCLLVPSRIRDIAADHADVEVLS